MTSNSSANVPQTNDASKICEGVNPLLMQEMESEEKKEIQKWVYGKEINNYFTFTNIDCLILL